MVGSGVVPRILQENCVVGQLQFVKLVALPAIVDQHGHSYVTDIACNVRLLSEFPGR